MTIQQVLRERNLSRYQLSKRSGIPWATLADICSGKTSLTRCSAGTLSKLSAALDMDSARAEAQKLEDETAQDGFWNDLERSQKVQQRLKQLQNKITRQDKLVTEWQDLTALCEMGQEADDAELLEELKAGFQTLEEKIDDVAKKIYRAGSVSYAPAAKKMLAELEKLGYGKLPVCIAKTQYSFSDDASLLGAPEGFTMNVREVRLSAGAGFVVVICGSIMTMPGLPKHPAAMDIDCDAEGKITGLF